jgi:hypothetical protein
MSFGWRRSIRAKFILALTSGIISDMDSKSNGSRYDICALIFTEFSKSFHQINKQAMDMELSNAIVIRNKDLNCRAAARKGRVDIIKCLFVLTIMH